MLHVSVMPFFILNYEKINPNFQLGVGVSIVDVPSIFVIGQIGLASSLAKTFSSLLVARIPPMWTG